MKIEINALMEKAAVLRDEERISRRIKLSEDVEGLELAVLQAEKDLKDIKSKWREGLAGRKVVLAHNNPIVFFGDVLTQKDNEL